MAEALQFISIQNGIVPFDEFSGNPYSYAVTLPIPFADNNYTVQIGSNADGRTWLAQSLTAEGFVINSQSQTRLTGNVFWTAQYINQ
jgi:hypothetical protein